MKKILIAEDEESLRGALKEMLVDQGYEVSEAKDGDECLALINSQPFDLLVTDIMMPGRDGLEVLEMILSRPNIEPIPTIVLTNRLDFTAKHKAFNFGAKAYLVKSDTPLEQIVVEIEKVVGKSS